jgi:hypothetical protein
MVAVPPRCVYLRQIRRCFFAAIAPIAVNCPSCAKTLENAPENSTNAVDAGGANR